MALTSGLFFPPRFHRVDSIKVILLCTLIDSGYQYTLTRPTFKVKILCFSNTCSVTEEINLLLLKAR